MSKQFIIISLCIIVAIFIAGWEMAILSNEYNKFSHITQAIPIIRFERFDKQRNALIIGLFNPGALPMEINRTELSFQRDDKLSRVVYSHQEYGEKPLVLDPDDTILVPLQKKQAMAFQSEKGSYWGELYFQIPGQTDFYSLHHRFNKN
jgi:hypothetical protein